jgi:hypothetical protein
MSTEHEFNRITPTKGKHYYAVLATRSYWDPNKDTPWGGKGYHRYFAPATHKRYMGEYIDCGSEGYGDGKTYWEIYLKDGTLYELQYDYSGMTCLEETEPLESDSGGPVPIDANIRQSTHTKIGRF